jgi:hypothetical protein
VGRVVEGTGGQRSGVGAGELETTNVMLRTAMPAAPEDRPA